MRLVIVSVTRSSPDFVRSLLPLPGNDFAVLTKRFNSAEQGCDCADAQIRKYRANVIFTTQPLTTTPITTSLVTTGRRITSGIQVTTSTEANAIMSSSEASSGNKYMGAIIASSVVGVLVLVASSIGLFLLGRKLGMKEARTKMEMDPLDESMSTNAIYRNTTKESAESAVALPMSRAQLPLGKTESDLIFQGNAKVLRLDTVVLGEIIGKGTFGIVYK